MNQKDKKIGLIIGREWDWPDAFIQGVNKSNQGVTAELVKLGGTFMNESCDYNLIIDRMSHEIPYYRSYLKYAAIHGVYIINSPLTLSSDNKFFSIGLINQLGFNSPRTVLLPNKHVDRDVVPDSFRNLQYPMNWQKIIGYVGVPAIIKDNHTGGRRRAFRVHNVDELIQRYDQSSTRTKILQQLIESDTHIHCFVFGQENVLVLQYSLANDAYLPEILAIDESRQQKLAQDALKITQAYKYDSNMVEFVIKDDTAFVINGTNPAPAIDHKLMTEEQFYWCVRQTVNMAIQRVKRPLPQEAIFKNILKEDK
jgi:hypothetical protein